MNLRFSAMTERLTSSAVRDILKLTQGGGIISFAGGLPAESLFPMEAVREAYERVFRSGGPAVLQYSITEGFPRLREQLSERMSRRDIGMPAENMIITTGSQQSIDLLCRILLDPGDAVLVEAPTYLAALQVMNTYRAEVRSVDSDDEGMLPDDLEAKIRTYRPKMIYVTPTFSNPAGRVWSAERREALARLGRQYGVLIAEDDPYGELKFDPDAKIPLIYELDRQYGGEPNVVYMSSFSKIVAPALRTGWTCGSAEVIRMLAKAKQAADLHSSSIDQRALSELIAGFDLDGHIRTVSEAYRARMQRLLELIGRQHWAGAKWNEPKGGMFVWIEMPEDIDTSELLRHAVAEGIAFVPGEVFFAESPQRNAMRVNFTHTDPELLPEAVARLDRAVRRMMDKRKPG